MVSDFKKQVYEDFKNVLLNADEFGRICSWNDLPLQIAEDARTDLGENYDAQGVNVERRKIYCRDMDLIPHPRVTEQVDFDGANWYVADVKNPFGFLEIVLERRIS
ncbi:MAG: hypothetical protein FWF51_12025 [Chitinivibrionia bacterium]|nr:hypothetical protein [Chitinivibrionia bacterium]